MLKTKTWLCPHRASILRERHSDDYILYFLQCGGSLVTKLGQTLGTPQTVTHQAPLSMEFSRQEYRSGLPFPSPRDRPEPGIEQDLLHCRRFPALQADSLPIEPPGVRTIICPKKQHKIVN